MLCSVCVAPHIALLRCTCFLPALPPPHHPGARLWLFDDDHAAAAHLARVHKELAKLPYTKADADAAVHAPKGNKGVRGAAASAGEAPGGGILIPEPSPSEPPLPLQGQGQSQGQGQATYLRLLGCIPRVAEADARAIAAAYPSLPRLHAAMTDPSKGEAARRGLLAGLERDSLQEEATGRRLGPVLSARVYRYVTAGEEAAEEQLI